MFLACRFAGDDVVLFADFQPTLTAPDCARSAAKIHRYFFRYLYCTMLNMAAFIPQLLLRRRRHCPALGPRLLHPLLPTKKKLLTRLENTVSSCRPTNRCLLICQKFSLAISNLILR